MMIDLYDRSMPIEGPMNRATQKLANTSPVNLVGFFYTWFCCKSGSGRTARAPSNITSAIKVQTSWLKLYRLYLTLQTCFLYSIPGVIFVNHLWTVQYMTY